MSSAICSLAFFPALENTLINVQNDSLLSNPVLLLSPHYIGSIWHCRPHCFIKDTLSISFWLCTFSVSSLGSFYSSHSWNVNIPQGSVLCSPLTPSLFSTCIPSSPDEFIYSHWMPSLCSLLVNTEFLLLVPSLWSTTRLLNRLFILPFVTGTSTLKLLFSLDSRDTTGLPLGQLPS